MARQYDRHRGSARQRGYTSAWDRAAKAHLAANPLCVGCLAVGRIVQAELVDHMRPHQGDKQLFWDQSNWQSACKVHHDTVKQRLELMWNEGRIDLADLSLASEPAQRLTRRFLG